MRARNSTADKKHKSSLIRKALASFDDLIMLPPHARPVHGGWCISAVPEGNIIVSSNHSLSSPGSAKLLSEAGKPGHDSG
jgi:hypothetical protein